MITKKHIVLFVFILVFSLICSSCSLSDISRKANGFTEKSETEIQSHTEKEDESNSAETDTIDAENTESNDEKLDNDTIDDMDEADNSESDESSVPENEVSYSDPTESVESENKAPTSDPSLPSESENEEPNHGSNEAGDSEKEINDSETDNPNSSKTDEKENKTDKPSESEQENENSKSKKSTDEDVPSSFWVKYIDVGQADAALVQCDGHYMLIDGGNKADSNLIYSVLKSYNASHLDIVVCTHPHEDHVGGLADAFNYATASLTLCSTTSYDSQGFSDFKKYADSKGNGITTPSVGDAYQLGSASVKILAVNSVKSGNSW